MPKLLLARDIINKNLTRIEHQCSELAAQGLKPFLSVILVGDNPASLAYVKNKRKMCEKIGAEFQLHHLPAHITENEFMERLTAINCDPKVTGCFVQLPIPEHLAHLDVTQLISPKKDVDGFHLDTTCNLYRGQLNSIIPCTPKGILTLLQENHIDVEGKNIVIIGRSHIVGKPLALILQALNGTVTLCHSKTKNLKGHCQRADIIISAVGKPQFLDASYLGQNQIVIDVGINRVAGRLVGDVDLESVEPNVQAITPVPGGVGPMTVFSLMENLIFTTQNILKEQQV